MTDKQQTAVDILTELSLLIGSADNLDWGELAIREEDAYRVMATHVLELLAKIPKEDQLVTIMSVATHLMVETFVLHLHLEMLRHQTFH